MEFVRGGADCGTRQRGANSTEPSFGLGREGRAGGGAGAGSGWGGESGQVAGSGAEVGSAKVALVRAFGLA